MTKPIATRTLYEIDNPEKTYLVEIFAPKLSADGLYRCEVRIEHAPQGLNQMFIGGSDSYQALILAIKSLHVMVDVFNKKFLGSRLRWENGSDDLGFAISTDSN